MCDISPKAPKPQVMPEKRELPAEPPKPLEIGTSGKDKRQRGNPFRIDLASSTATRGASGAQV